MRLLSDLMEVPDGPMDELKRYEVRAILENDLRAVNLPNHSQALQNLDFTNVRLRIERVEIKV